MGIQNSKPKVESQYEVSSPHLKGWNFRKRISQPLKRLADDGRQKMAAGGDNADAPKDKERQEQGQAHEEKQAAETGDLDREDDDEEGNKTIEAVRVQNDGKQVIETCIPPRANMSRRIIDKLLRRKAAAAGDTLFTTINLGESKEQHADGRSALDAQHESCRKPKTAGTSSTMDIQNDCSDKLMALSRRTESEPLPMSVPAAEHPSDDNDTVAMQADPSLPDDSPTVAVKSLVTQIVGLADTIDYESNYPAADISRWQPDVAAKQDQYSSDAPDMPVELCAGNNLDRLALMSEKGMEVITFGDVGDSAEQLLKSSGKAGDLHGGKSDRQGDADKRDDDLGINSNNNTSPSGEQKQQTNVLKTTLIAVQESSSERREFKLDTPRRDEQVQNETVRVDSPGGAMICSGGVCRLAVRSNQWTMKTKHDQEPNEQQGGDVSEKMARVD